MKLNEIRPQYESIFWLAPIVLLLFAVVPHLPYGFYTFLRIAVSVCAAMVIHRNVEAKAQPYWIYVFGAAVVLFNPIIPVHLHRSEWIPINLLAAAIFAANMLALKRKDL